MADEWDFEKLASKDSAEVWLRIASNRERDAQIKTMRRHVASELNRVAKRADDGKFPRRKRNSEAPLLVEIESGVAKIMALHGDNVVPIKGEEFRTVEDLKDVGAALRSYAKYVTEGHADEELSKIHNQTGAEPMPPRRGRRKKTA